MQKYDFVKGYSFFGHPVYSPFAALVGDLDDSLSEFLGARLGDALLAFDSSFESVQNAAKLVLWSDQRLHETPHLGLERRYLLERLENALRESLRRLLGFVVADEESVRELAEPVETGAGEPGTPGSATGMGGASAVHRRLEGLRLRSAKIVEQVAGVLQLEDEGWSDARVGVLDVGCGDGVVANTLVTRLRDAGAEVTAVLADVTDYRAQEVKDGGAGGALAFVKLPPDYEQLALDQRSGGAVRAEQKFNIILLLTVLHHSQLPSRVFRACVEKAAPGARLVVIESCVGIDESDLTPAGSGQTDQEADQGRAARTRFAQLGLDEQLRYAAFVDWFYNRVLQTTDDVFVPCNFGTPEEWNELFGEFAGCEVVHTVHMGFDQPLVPEYHTIHVVRIRVPTDGAQP